MTPQRPRMYYTAVFLHVSFKAIKHSMAGKASDGLPCWLDSKMLMMLCGDLKACRDQAATRDGVHQSLEVACIECDALLARCPGGLDSTLCHCHLDAILEALQDAIDALTTVAEPADTSLWRNASRYFLQDWKRHS